ncbi:sporozoite and liver stage asparagine-rich protein [Plasmodium brasilianum]|uniref:Sporozoite and liver stage asparagine-rich protein n=1 Tax=Plasmodium brasilianum TaxID=5824 RepID=A0ACB9YC65_PLABR|nr:sporozoite and liver stage asparagine-rich protein [Plasmodium brasilianum]
MRKGKPRHVPMFLRSENKKIFFTFFSYFMSKNDLNFIFEHYDIGLIVLTKIHNIRKKYEDEKNNMQREENKLDIEETELFDEKVRAFFLNYKINSTNGEKVDDKKGKNDKNKKNKKNDLDNEKKQENSNKRSSIQDNSSIHENSKIEENKSPSDYNESHYLKIKDKINDTINDKNSRNHNDNNDIQRSEEGIDNKKLCIKNVKSELDKCNNTNHSFTQDKYEHSDNRNGITENKNALSNINNLTQEIYEQVEEKNNNERVNGNNVKIEKEDKNKEKKIMVSRDEISKNINVEKQENEEIVMNKEDIDKKQQECHHDPIHQMIQHVKKESIINGLNIKEHNNNNIREKDIDQEEINIEKEADDVIFPIRKKNETYKKFSKRINRKKINEFIDYHDEHCFYITDLCKKGTMLSLKKNELINHKGNKYKFSLYPKFINTLGTNQNISFNNELQALNNRFMNAKLCKRQLNEKNFNELNNIQMNKNKISSHSWTPINEHITVQNLLQAYDNCNNNAYSNNNNNNNNNSNSSSNNRHVYNLNNVENLLYAYNHLNGKSLHNAIYTANLEQSYTRNPVIENDTSYINLNYSNDNYFRNQLEVNSEENNSDLLCNSPYIVNDKRKSYLKFEITENAFPNKYEKKNKTENITKIEHQNEQDEEKQYNFMNYETSKVKNEHISTIGNYSQDTINNVIDRNSDSNDIGMVQNYFNEVQSLYTNANSEKNIYNNINNSSNNNSNSNNSNSNSNSSNSNSNNSSSNNNNNNNNNNII